MRSAQDRTSRAIIRDEALRLFSERNADAVTVRDIAAAAGVSPALVLRHYGSKAGLIAAVDEHVVLLFEAMLADVTAPPAEGGAPLDESAVPTLAQRLAEHMPAESPIPAYLSRMLLSPGPSGAALFARLHGLARESLASLVVEGVADDGGDPAVRAAFLLVNDLAMIMLRERLTEVLGVDPLSPVGLRRWGAQVFSIYGGGLATGPTSTRFPEAR